MPASSKCLIVEADPAEHCMQLLCAAYRIPCTFEARQLVVDLLEGDTIAPVVTAGFAECHLTAEDVSDDFGDLSNSVVLLAGAHIEHFVVNQITGRRKHPADRLTDSSAWTSGRQGVPSLTIAILPVVHESPAKLFKTMSNRIRGEAPKAVALRMKVGEKLSSAIRLKSRSTRVLHSAYAVCGFTGEVSSTSPWHAVHAARRHVHEALDTDSLG